MRASRMNDAEITTEKSLTGDGSVIIVNMPDDKGFAVISGRKEFAPILAYAYEGRFDIQKLNEPVKQWLYAVTDSMSNRLNQPDSIISKNRQSWIAYAPQRRVKLSEHCSRSISDEEYMQLQLIFQDSIGSWERQGFKVYSMREYVDMDPVGNAWAEVDENTVYPQYWEDVDRISFVVVKNTGQIFTTGSPIATRWHQDMPYNSYFPSIGSLSHAYTGCGSMAAAIIMSYHKHPSYINWSNIKYDGYSDELGLLLYNLASKSDASYKADGTGITTGNMLKTIKSYGYSAEKSSYDETKVNKSLMDGSPVYMTSSYKRNGKDTHHAWVICSRRIVVSYQTVEVWTFLSRNKFERWHWQQSHTESLPHFYVNWGWGGSQNGYYNSLGSICPTGVTDFEYNDAIYNIKPNK